MTDADPELRRQKLLKRRRTIGITIMVVAPILMLLALKSFNMSWSTAIFLNILCWSVVLFRWRLREGTWPWQLYRG
ncbi:hypothetical protein [Mycolicibacterium alvei]|uniref:hypothetical protein n=1 Tax=Mycolicibacterium alvei TaxID=67081 RepID=UPI0013D7A629|nr:hypothetical protein [Mycolicibacterium alvei]MCV7003623.1 hypothetical protein [Mycolicibacterium alvei]